MSVPLLEERIRRLERRGRVLGALLVAGLGFLVVSANGRRGETVAAERFELVDGEGRVRAEMAIDEDGSAGFFVRDGEGRVRGCLVHDDAQSALYLFDEAGAIRVGAAQYAHGGGGFALHGEGTEGAAVLYMKEREGSLTFYDAHGTVRARLPE